MKKVPMTLMKHIKWDFNSLPHMLISGGTGGENILHSYPCRLFVAFGADVRILDPKNADLADLEFLNGGVFSQRRYYDDLKNSVQDMMQRMEDEKSSEL
ncbi:hypothetical protein ACEQPO_08335 [Bacillus sp. SL00103]